jgi:hypothetical protein
MPGVPEAQMHTFRYFPDGLFKRGVWIGGNPTDGMDAIQFSDVHLLFTGQRVVSGSYSRIDNGLPHGMLLLGIYICGLPSL